MKTKLAKIIEWIIAALLALLVAIVTLYLIQFFEVKRLNEIHEKEKIHAEQIR